MLETLDLAGTIKFYVETIGFTCDSYSAEARWASLKRDGVRIMFSFPNAHRNIKAPILSGSLYLRSDNVDAVWSHLKDRCSICYPIENFKYGMREFAVFDNNGYLLQFGQAI